MYVAVHLHLGFHILVGENYMSKGLITALVTKNAFIISVSRAFPVGHAAHPEQNNEEKLRKTDKMKEETKKRRKEERKRGRKEGSNQKKERKERMKEGRKERRKKGRKEDRNKRRGNK